MELPKYLHANAVTRLIHSRGNVTRVQNYTNAPSGNRTQVYPTTTGGTNHYTKSAVNLSRSLVSNHQQPVSVLLGGHRRANERAINYGEVPEHKGIRYTSGRHVVFPLAVAS